MNDGSLPLCSVGIIAQFRSTAIAVEDEIDPDLETALKAVDERFETISRSMGMHSIHMVEMLLLKAQAIPSRRKTARCYLAIVTFDAPILWLR